MSDLHELGAAEAARRIRAGRLRPSELLEACLERIDAVEPAVAAWVELDRAGARRAAAERDRDTADGRFLGPLHGVPVAIKDIFDVAGLPTRCGAPPFAHRRPDADATSVARLRAAGAVLLGKTVTTTFAYRDPGPTRNPWNLAHTPGGSSSGSAAAVAARMVPLALGTQTVGSVLRPAAFCGVVGLKPSHGRISTAGVVPLCWSTDHVGVFARHVEDVALALGLLAGPDPADPRSAPAFPEDPGPALEGAAPPRLALPRRLLERAEPALAAHLEAVARRFAEAGAHVAEATLPPSFDELHAAGETLVRAEAAAFHRDLFARHGADYPPGIRELVTRGLAVAAVDYLAAQATRRRAREELARLLAGHDALLYPVAPGPAPSGLAWTGDAWFCAPASFTGLPSIALPSGLDPGGLPLAVQLVSGPFAEARLLGAAAWCERRLDAPAGPRL
jgi:Asp-tRNA(Asn)/Glu-tRNA(Gln) amidotransferase A subunit family amidase